MMAVLSLVTTMVDRSAVFTTSPVIGLISIRSLTLNGTFDQQDEPAHQIGDNVLQTEADAEGAS